MKKTIILFRKTVLVALVVALSLAAFPLTSVYASGLNDPTDPPAGDETGHSGVRLERAWARLQRAYERQGRMLGRADTMAEKIQNLIDRMEENGKDVTASQAALDPFEDALKDAHPIYESAKSIINSHKGFDDDGKVTDREKAVKTVKDLGGKLKEIRGIVGEPGKALREAIKAFHDAHRPAGASGAEG